MKDSRKAEAAQVKTLSRMSHTTIQVPVRPADFGRKLGKISAKRSPHGAGRLLILSSLKKIHVIRMLLLQVFKTYFY